MNHPRPSITIEYVAKEDRLVIKSMLDEYLSELGDATAYPYLDLYWQESTRFPYLIRVGSEVAGFALVRKNERDRFEIAEFCVLASFRRRGTGSAAAAAIFSAYSGEWEVRSFPGNAAAAAFWERVITACAGDGCQTVENGVWVFEILRLRC
jgi:predicted acetyltransferase